MARCGILRVSCSVLLSPRVPCGALVSFFFFFFFFFFNILIFFYLCDEPRRSLPHERSTMQQFQPILGQKFYGMYICVNFARLPALSQVFYSRLSYNSQVKPRREKIELNNCKGIKPPQSHKKKENIRSPLDRNSLNNCSFRRKVCLL